MLNKISSKNIDIINISNQLNSTDINNLIDLLNEKDCTLRSNALNILKYHSQKNSDIFPYINDFKNKLSSNNSFQRNIGIVLISENIRWDIDLIKFKDIYEEYMTHCTDEKFITSRYAIQNIINFIPYTEEYLKDIINKLISIDIFIFKESQYKLILLDIIYILIEINNLKSFNNINKYINNALEGNILNNKEKENIISLI